MSRSVEQMVNHQVLRYLQEIRRSDVLSNVGSNADARSQTQQRPMITISREYGAYGGAMGRILARELNIEFLSQELLQEVAARADVRRQVIEALDERSQSGMQLWVDQLISLRRFESSDYVRALSETMLAVARHRAAVIVGRAGHLILDSARTLRVRVYAPLDKRIEYVAEREGMSALEAKLKIERVDNERAAFFRQHFDKDIADPLLYDILLNTGTMSLESGAQVIAEAYRQRF